MIQTHTIESPDLRVEVIPQLGGKVSSLLDKRNGYEWLWGLDRDRPLFMNRPGDLFDDSTMLGIDECIPTVAPCEVDGKALADHGDAWSKPWEIEPADPDSPQSIALSVEVCESSLWFSRRLTLDADTVVLDYTLRNQTDAVVPVLWCIHPLFKVTPQTRLRIPQVEGCVGRVEAAGGLPLAMDQALAFPEVSPGVRLDETGLPEGSCAKLFYRLCEKPGGLVEARMEEPGAGSLTLAFESSEWLNTLGLWINRGGWQGYQHLAIEPTNGGYDRLSDAIAKDPGTAWRLEPKQEHRWRLRMRAEVE